MLPTVSGLTDEHICSADRLECVSVVRVDVRIAEVGSVSDTLGNISFGNVDFNLCRIQNVSRGNKSEFYILIELDELTHWIFTEVRQAQINVVLGVNWGVLTSVLL